MIILYTNQGTRHRQQRFIVQQYHPQNEYRQQTGAVTGKHIVAGIGNNKNIRGVHSRKKKSDMNEISVQIAV